MGRLMEREAFLNRIAMGLGRGRVTDAPDRDVRGVPDHYRANPYACDAGTATTLPERFKVALEAIGGKVIIAEDRTMAGDALRGLLDELAPSITVTWDRSEFAGWPVDWLWDVRGAVPIGGGAAKSAGAGSLRETALAADVGITVADCAVANTGTLMLAASAARPRSASLLPLVHIALISADQIVDRMGQAMERFAGVDPRDIPSSINFITGQSRSGDIEGDLSIGVHGPGAIYVIVALAGGKLN
jgi:L-lactate dehydrogenase complex protein LldG